MDAKDIRSQLNRVVRLSFRDGEIVEALLLGADPERDHDLTYEVRRIISRSSSARRHLVVGATLVAALADLERWDSV